MLEIEGAYYNANDIRKLARTNRNNLIIEYINGEQHVTNYYYNDYMFAKLVKEWEKCLK